ncbi:helix-turn-helix transcriptional regulator [soil metagenome]
MTQSPVFKADAPAVNVFSTPLVVLSRTFPARPSSFPDIEDFVRESLNNAPLSKETRTQVTEAVLAALLGAAGPEDASIHVALRVSPGGVEVDVLRNAVGSDTFEPPEGTEPTFADWMGSVLARRGLSQEAAARQLGVSVRTMSRWVAGATEPRLRDLRRIRDIFGEVPLN